MALRIALCSLFLAGAVFADDPKRAQHVIRVLKAKKGDTIADIGCGTGWISKAIAKVVGPEGKEYAVEIRKDLVAMLRQENVPQLVPVLSKPHDVTLPVGTVDVAFLHDVADHVDKRARPGFYASIARALRRNGRLVIFDPRGNAAAHLKELRGCGFRPETPKDLANLQPRELDKRLHQGIRFRYRPRGRPERAKHVIEILKAKQGDTIADISCGNGWISKAIAKVVGPEGKVYAVEIKKDRVAKLRQENVPQLVPVLSKPHDVTLPASTVDVAFLHDVADHVDKKVRPAFYASIARALKPGGYLVIFDPHRGIAAHLKELRGYGFVLETPRDLAGLSPKDLDEWLWQGIRFVYRKQRAD